MVLLKKWGKGLLISIVCLIFLTFLMTVLNYINFIKYGVINILEIIIIFISIFIGSFSVGKNSLKKGWLEGIKFGLIFLIILILFNYFGFNIKFEVKNLIYYLILIASSTLGSMIGMNLKKEK